MTKKLNNNDLIEFEKDIKQIYEKGLIKAPIHLSGNNEKQLIKIFKNIKTTDWVFSTWRNHYHALLHGINASWLKNQIIKGKSMSINSLKKKFYSSAIVGGILPIALGVSMGLKRKKSKNKVWVFYWRYDL
jgi:TPP-dependent pyruvate/acetoin dehydrogenase alpha subunit